MTQPTPNTQGASWEDSFTEEAAAMEHERWAGWQRYLHSKCVEHENGKGEWVCFPSERFKHWERQINTPYSELSEKEKESDRAEVRQYLPLIRTLLSKERAEGERREQKLLDALESMYEQYCSHGHSFMRAGEYASAVLKEYGYSFDGGGRLKSYPTLPADSTEKH